MQKTPPKIDTKNARLKLAKRGKPYWWPVASGIYLGYRAGPGTWNVRAADGVGGNWIKSLDAVADDHEEADNIKVLSFDQASTKARTIARGTDAKATGAPVTVDQALSDYREDLIANGQPMINESHPRYHLTPALLVRQVGQLTIREMKTWRNSLLGNGIKASTVNRLNKGLKAALNQAAQQDKRISNSEAWTIGLAALPEDEVTEANLVLSDEQRRDVVNASYAISPELGLYVEVHAATGARSSQIAMLNVVDLQLGAKPLLQVPSSLKGKNRKTRTRKPMPISAIWPHG